ncbi:hypothetical protein FGRMN_1393 [Fusarium graminum]|nr:hypothetical protein FGRMN_1393 [Fusarium graminum]
MAEDPSFCVHISRQCPIENTTYGYRVNLWVNCVFVIIFTVAFFANIWLGIRFRIRSYAVVMALGCLAQLLGYAGRTSMHFLPFNAIPFQIQVCCLIIGPAFNNAAIYLILKHIVFVFGPQWSPLKPKQYTILFIGADIVSLVLQPTGGGLSATARIEDKDQVNMGNTIMMTGIAFQVVALSTFAALSLLFMARRLHAATASPLTGNALHIWRSVKFRLYIGGLFTAFITIYIRCVYRIAEMKDGWGSKLMKEEVPFIILEGVSVTHLEFLLYLRWMLTGCEQDDDYRNFDPDTPPPWTALSIIRREKA